MLTLVETVGDIAVFRVDADVLDLSNARQFKRTAQALLREHPKALFDMRGLTFIDSAGLGALLSCLRHVASKDGDLRLFGVTKQVQAVLELVRMHKILDIFEAKDDALHAFEV